MSTTCGILGRREGGGGEGRGGEGKNLQGLYFAAVAHFSAVCARKKKNLKENSPI